MRSCESKTPKAGLSASDGISVLDSAFILALGGTVHSDDAISVRNSGRIRVDGGTFSAGTLVIGNGGFGSAQVALIDTDVTIGSEILIGLDGGPGRLDLLGNTSLTLDTSQLSLGDDGGTSDLNIEDGAELSLSGNAVWGTAALVRVDIEDGGVLNVDGLTLGAGRSGNIDLIGATSELNITAGLVEIGAVAGSNGSLVITEGAQLILPDALHVGAASAGDLRTDDGALTVNGDLIFGRDATGNGDWFIDASNSLVVDVAADVIIGGLGEGEIEAEAENAQILIANNFIVGDQGIGRGFFDEFFDSTIDVAGDSTVGNGAFGVLNINGGEWHTQGITRIGANAGAQSTLFCYGRVERSVARWRLGRWRR